MTRITDRKRADLAKHALTTVIETDAVQVYRMGKPGSGIFCVYLSFTPGGIFMQGDICLGRDQNGIGSNGGYGREWFLNQGGPDRSRGYLCSKFLSKQWQPAVARQDVRARLAEAKKEHDEDGDDFTAAALQAWKTIAEELQTDELTPEILLTAADSTTLCDFWDYEVGIDYPVGDAGWLCAIAVRFRELWDAKKAEAGA